jgi:hypothetical protein
VAYGLANPSSVEPTRRSHAFHPHHSACPTR